MSPQLDKYSPVLMGFPFLKSRDMVGTEREAQVVVQEEEEWSESSNGQPKHCTRGHWRPAEDAKLRELVSQHGPQNWNRIAENLEGRSGKKNKCK